MTSPELAPTVRSEPVRYRHDTPEFARIVTLSDGVFAIALTLLVLTLDVPDVGAERLGAALLAEAPQVIVCALSFLLVANLWWFHHKLVAQLALFEPGMVGLNLGLLGLVALVPFPTNLVGSAPTARAAVLPLLGVFVAISLVYLVIVLRVHRVGAWRNPPPPSLFRWVVIGWIGQLVGMVLAMAVALWLPVAGLVVAGATGTLVGGLMSVLAPPSYRAWRARPGL